MKSFEAIIVKTVLLLVFLTGPGCSSEDERYDHSTAHVSGHDHHEEGHGHGGAPVASFTLWSEHFEVFAEHAPGLVGRNIFFLIHVTVLNGFSAPKSGRLTLEFDGPAKLSVTAAGPVRPGIYSVALTPKIKGLYQGRIRIEGQVSGVVEGVRFQVFDDILSAAKSVPEDDDHGVIEFLKEQQWRVPFATKFAMTATISAAVVVAGQVDTPPDGRAEVSAPVTGRLIAPRAGLPRPGIVIRKGQLLATLLPAPSSPESSARAGLAQAEAKARASAARAALKRAQRLIKTEAISRRELQDARLELGVAEAAVRAAKQAAALYAGSRGQGSQTRWRLTAPINGSLVAVHARPGATVSPGETLFEILDTKELWLVAQVPEQDANRLRLDRNARYQVAGQGAWHDIEMSGRGAKDSLVMLGRTVDPISRTVRVIYSLRSLNDSLRVGGLVQVSLPTGDEFSGVVIPKSALLDQEGRSVVYVQVDGEHFEERAVRTGPRAGGRVGIVEGLKAGERIVRTGAHLLRLAERAGDEPSHGHIH